ncbi:Crp/Fnr family transcriptional regulator [Pedobacter frigoris]|uniref:Cyclic nucleotide-binding domain-containing protein n=1 Tax=Pedobacter frigoris TaxID=2571272 RepID=A0A4U1CNU1_9SPHI|nr:cyclic nucleotide-binding domain-containing protein [Pedobacter frigoris]TKC07125.1 cyclic nucleotide-binding domain-containing protein [Pedobacter frigoris]
MLTIKNAFERLMRLLRSIKPEQPLPVLLEPYLLKNMDEYSPASGEVLVKQGEKPKFAYFIIRGYIYVYLHDENGGKHVKRFYRENRIVAFLSFLELTNSPYTIVAGHDTLVSKIGIEEMTVIYDTWKGMKEFAQLVVMQYDEVKEGQHLKLLNMAADDRVREFYNLYPCMWPPLKARMDDEIAEYLQISARTLRRIRKQ